jgi:[ribosomal protein S5]-alanine N-acetyltransferase
MSFKLLPVHQKLEDNTEFLHLPEEVSLLRMTIGYFDKVGYNPPWIGYFAERDGVLVGQGAFKGGPANGCVEIAYSTFEVFQKQGIATAVCRELVALSQATDPTVRITARTLPEPNFSTRVLEKNGFRLLGVVEDMEDGQIWEWEWIAT